MKLIFVTFIFALASTAGAEPMNGGTKIKECEAPFNACKAAGYKVGAHKKGDKEGADMGLWIDCIDAVADGKKQVSGVDPSAAKACKDAQKAHKASK